MKVKLSALIATIVISLGLQAVAKDTALQKNIAPAYFYDPAVHGQNNSVRIDVLEEKPFEPVINETTKQLVVLTLSALWSFGMVVMLARKRRRAEG